MKLLTSNKARVENRVPHEERINMGYIAGVGLLNCDLLFSGLNRLPEEGEELFAKGFDLQLGGGVPAVMIHLRRLGVPVRLATFLGEDRFSRFAREQLEAEDVLFRNLYHGSGMPLNVTCVAITPRDRTFLSYRDAVPVTDEVLEEMYQECRGASIVRMYNNFYEVYARVKREQPDTLFVLDTEWDESLSLKTLGPYLELADYYTPNCKEALHLTGTDDPHRAAEVLSDYFDAAIVKLGADGCLLRQNGTEEIIPVVPGVEAVDATGAGDAFNAGFLYGLYHGYPVRDCIRFGSVTGAECVRHVGCLTGRLTEQQLLETARRLQA